MALREVALWVTERVLRHLPESIEPDGLAERAGLLNNLGKQAARVRSKSERSSTRFRPGSGCALPQAG